MDFTGRFIVEKGPVTSYVNLHCTRLRLLEILLTSFLTVCLRGRTLASRSLCVPLVFAIGKWEPRPNSSSQSPYLLELPYLSVHIFSYSSPNIGLKLPN